MMSELEATLAILDAKNSVRAVVIAGQGPDFCSSSETARVKRTAGAQKTLNKGVAMAMGRLLERIDGMKKATIARIHGVVHGRVLGLIAACDVAVAAMDAEFSAPEWGLDPSAATMAPYLIRAMGERQARRYLLTGEKFPAAEAYRMGMVHELAPPADLDARINEILGYLLAGNPQALPMAKEIIVKAARKNRSFG